LISGYFQVGVIEYAFGDSAFYQTGISKRVTQMGWESRKDSPRKYYTRSRKRFGRVEREYVGCGPLANLEASLDDLRRRELAEATRQRRESELRALDEYKKWQQSMAELCRIESEVLLAIGFHVHRGQLRFKRIMSNQTISVWDKLRQADSGDPKSIKAVRDELDGPNRQLILEQAGDLARQCERLVFSSLDDDQEGAEIVIREKMSEIKLELAPTNAIETLIVDRIVQCWLQLHMAEILALMESPPQKALEARVDSLNRRYLQGLRTLASVRKVTARVTRHVTTTMELDR
jgi:hypothetical protein